jgi:hypothetical protein
MVRPVDAQWLGHVRLPLVLASVWERLINDIFLAKVLKNFNFYLVRFSTLKNFMPNIQEEKKLAMYIVFSNTKARTLLCQKPLQGTYKLCNAL